MSSGEPGAACLSWVQPCVAVWQHWPSLGIFVYLSRFAAAGEHRLCPDATLAMCLAGEEGQEVVLGNVCGKQPWQDSVGGSGSIGMFPFPP